MHGSGIWFPINHHTRFRSKYSQERRRAIRIKLERAHVVPGISIAVALGTATPRGQRLSTTQLVTREVTRSVVNRVAGQVAADLGKQILGKQMGSTIGRAIVRGTLGGVLRR